MHMVHYPGKLITTCTVGHHRFNETTIASTFTIEPGAHQPHRRRPSLSDRVCTGCGHLQQTFAINLNSQFLVCLASCAASI